MKHLTAAGAVPPKPEHLVNWSGTHECRTQVGPGQQQCADTAAVRAPLQLQAAAL